MVARNQDAATARVKFEDSSHSRGVRPFPTSTANSQT